MIYKRFFLNYGKNGIKKYIFMANSSGKITLQDLKF